MKIIFISQRSDLDSHTGEIRDALDSNWHNFMKECGCVAIPVPNNVNVFRELILHIVPDGIILSGGNTPIAYGGTSKERDAIDHLLIKYAIENNVPLIGVCRGMQSISLYFGGNLKKISGHVKTFHKINGFYDVVVNSFHTWAIDYPGDNLRVLSKSEDGCVEMIKHDSFEIYGIMWHPERNSLFSIEDVKLFKQVFGADL